MNEAPMMLSLAGNQDVAITGSGGSLGKCV